MPRFAFAVALLPLLAAPVFAAETHLTIGETATVMVAPDEIAASLRAEATANSAAEVQKRVNDAIRDALAATKDSPDVTASTGGYGVWRWAQGGVDRWQGGQSLNLSSHDGAALLKLVGLLQQKGMAISGLNWRLSRDASRKARQDATHKALASLRARVDEAAAALDLKFEQFASVRVDSAQPPQARMSAPMAISASLASTPPPAAVAEDTPVTASVEADAILVPR
ncbi:MAG: SIMPL domain-containing protein [Rhodospirillales bacterium]